MKGSFLWFTYPEVEIYGGISMAIGAVAVIKILAYSNSSYMLARLMFFVTPFVLIIAIARAGIMIFRLDVSFLLACARASRFARR